MDLSHLSDDELQQNLLDFGIPVSDVPISSSREFFERKLMKLMGGDVSTSFSGEVDDDDDSQDNSDHGSPVARSHDLRRRRSNETANASPNIRLRTNVTESVAYDPYRHTPSPRPSLRAVSSAAKNTYSYDDVDGRRKSDFSFSRFFVKLIFVVLLFVAVYYAYVYVYSDNPLKHLEKLARDALTAAEKAKENLLKTSKTITPTDAPNTQLPKSTPTPKI